LLRANLLGVSPAGREEQRHRVEAPSGPGEAVARRRFEIDDDVHSISADSQRACTHIVNVLTAINPKVRAGIWGPTVKGFVDRTNYSSGRSRNSNSRWRQVAGRNTALGQSEFHWDDPAVGAEDTCPISTNRGNLCCITGCSGLHLKCDPCEFVLQRTRGDGQAFKLVSLRPPYRGRDSAARCPCHPRCCFVWERVLVVP